MCSPTTRLFLVRVPLGELNTEPKPTVVPGDLRSFQQAVTEGISWLLQVQLRGAGGDNTFVNRLNGVCNFFAGSKTYQGVGHVVNNDRTKTTGKSLLQLRQGLRWSVNHRL